MSFHLPTPLLESIYAQRCTNLSRTPLGPEKLPPTTSTPHPIPIS